MKKLKLFKRNEYGDSGVGILAGIMVGMLIGVGGIFGLMQFFQSSVNEAYIPQTDEAVELIRKELVANPDAKIITIEEDSGILYLNVDGERVEAPEPAENPATGDMIRLYAGGDSDGFWVLATSDEDILPAGEWDNREIKPDVTNKTVPNIPEGSDSVGYFYNSVTDKSDMMVAGE